MDSKILLGKILQRFFDKKIAKVEGYNSFGYLRETNNSVYVTREGGDDTLIPFNKIIDGIEAYQSNSELYDTPPTVLREFGIAHFTSPIFAFLHLLSKEDYENGDIKTEGQSELIKKIETLINLLSPPSAAKRKKLTYEELVEEYCKRIRLSTLKGKNNNITE